MRMRCKAWRPRGPRIAIAGTFAAGADLLGEPLAAFDDKSPLSDGFVAELDARGRRTWAATFGGKLDDAVAGVAIDDVGRVVVAATARDVVHLGGADLVARGAGDGLVGWWAADGSAGHATLIGGADFDGLRAIAAVGDRIVIGGFYSGAMELAGRVAHGGRRRRCVPRRARRRTVRSSTAWPVGGSGREEITAVSRDPGRLHRRHRAHGRRQRRWRRPALAQGSDERRRDRRAPGPLVRLRRASARALRAGP